VFFFDKKMSNRLDCRSIQSNGLAMKTKKIFKFTALHNAQTFADHCEKMHGIILGDDQRFWIVCMADFDRMIKAGYEAA
jgi:hypothetical protein